LAFHSGREAEHSTPSSAEVKECVELYFHSPNTPSWLGAQLGEAQGQLYFYLLKPVFNAVTAVSYWRSATHIAGGNTADATVWFSDWVHSASFEIAHARDAKLRKGYLQMAN
jgi:heme-degrading monooxygenase HmoA